MLDEVDAVQSIHQVGEEDYQGMSRCKIMDFAEETCGIEAQAYHA